MSTSQQQLSNQQYEVVLKYMETTNEDDFDRAVQMLRAHEFILQNAINTKFGLAEDAHHPQHHNQNASQEVRRTRSQEDIKKYLQYLREKQNRSVIGGIFVFAKNLLVGLLSGLTQLILPEFLLAKIMRTRFYVTYKQLILPQFRDRTLSYLLRNSNLSRKPIMYAIAAPGTIHQCFIDLLNRPQIVKKIDEGFIFSGGMSDDKQNKQIEGEKQPPSLIVCRKNIFEKIEIIKRYIGPDAISQIDVHKLNYALRDHQRATRKDKNLLVKYRNYIRSNYYGGRAGYYEQQQQQQQLYGASDHHTVVSDMIQKQNQDYKKIEEETKRKTSIEMQEKQRMVEEQKKLQELQEQRRIRKLSIPEQPNQGQIIRINFRCPDGTTKTRNFDNSQKLDLVYHYVETNQEIQFEDNNKRSFQLMYGFPPSSLADKRQQVLKNVFESDQQKIMIREL